MAFCDFSITLLMGKMLIRQVKNTTVITEFHFSGFSLLTEVRSFLFIMVSVVYIVTVTANIFIISVIITDQRLHKPMYIFIAGLSFIEIWYPSVTVPTLLWALLSKGKTISVASCLSQFYFHFSLGTTESFLLTIMSYDRYVAICNPFHYFTIMSPRACKRQLAGCWAGGFIVIIILCLQVANLSYCDGDTIDHYYCDFAALIVLSCSETSRVEMLFFISACFIILGCFLLIVMSYIQIIRTTMSFPTSAGRRKTFSTCASHLIVVCLFYGTNIFMFVRLNSTNVLHMNKSVSIIPSVVTPLLNPIIYTLRNQEVKEAVMKAVQKIHFYK